MDTTSTIIEEQKARELFLYKGFGIIVFDARGNPTLLFDNFLKVQHNSVNESSLRDGFLLFLE